MLGACNGPPAPTPYDDGRRRGARSRGFNAARWLSAAVAPIDARPEADTSHGQRGAHRFRGVRGGTWVWHAAYHGAARPGGTRAATFSAPGSRWERGEVAV